MSAEAQSNGLQKYFALRKNAGMSLIKYNPHSSEDCFGFGSKYTKKKLGDSLVNRDGALKRICKYKRKPKKEPKALNNQNKTFLAQTRKIVPLGSSTRYRFF